MTAHSKLRCLTFSGKLASIELTTKTILHDVITTKETTHIVYRPHPVPVSVIWFSLLQLQVPRVNCGPKTLNGKFKTKV